MARQFAPLGKLLGVMVVAGVVTTITWPLVPVALAVVGFVAVLIMAWRVGLQRRGTW